MTKQQTSLATAIAAARELAIDRGTATVGCSNREYRAEAGTSHWGRLVAQVWANGRVDPKATTKTEKALLDEMTKLNSHGGKREGSGRKPGTFSALPSSVFSVRLSPELRDWLMSRGGSAYLVDLLERERQK